MRKKKRYFNALALSAPLGALGTILRNEGRRTPPTTCNFDVV
ncbi:MAG: hypothetical protein PHO46_09900 [Thermoguttaceae bacterium]|jgi:hypothetical protein|nr:hypothetical protein [Thermoguttaceae bacterium]